MPWQFIHIDLFSPSALSRGKAELEQERWWGRGSKARRSERSGKESYATTIIAMTSSSLYPVPWGSEFTMSCLSFKSLPSLLLIKYGCARWIIYTVIDCKLQQWHCNLIYKVEQCKQLWRRVQCALYCWAAKCCTSATYCAGAPLAPGHYSTRWWTLNHHFLPPHLPFASLVSCA